MPIPESDFIDDLIDILEKNGQPYIIAVMDGGGCGTSGGVRVSSNIDKWTDGRDVALREDVISMLDATVFNEEAE